MDFYQKYMKYKTKYFNLREQTGGAGELKVIFLTDDAVRKILEEDTRLIENLNNTKTKIEKYMKNLILLFPQKGGIRFFKDATQKALDVKKKADVSISSAKTQTMEKVEKKIKELKILLDETLLQTTKCNITENGMPFYNSLTLKEKLTWKVENLDNVHYTYYGKDMNTINKGKASGISANLKTGYGENYTNLKAITDKISGIKYIILVKDFAGSPDLFICCFKVDGTNIKIADPAELKKELKLGTNGQKIKTEIINIIKESIKKISDIEIINTLDGIINSILSTSA